MPDISMCSDIKCPSHHKCYRFMAIPSEHWQAYGGYSCPEGAEKCDSFVPIEEAR